MTAFAAPLAARAQPARASVKLGFLARGAAPAFNRFSAALRERGWSEGENLTFALGLWGEHPARARELANDLVAAGVDVILAVGPEAAAAAKDATTSVPIVMLWSVDPVRFGLAQTLASDDRRRHPRG